ncbi:hypothetical protein [Actinoplanes couchii]|uniref:Uncharacterized protein n=1 Tax=Actinoplanes couchii TaxID=403638 RepID=A0ABQ3XQK4_9ACTN|nr:hypothetical protein [Actinoplanes couchii]MDR6317483.1 hypothetical protein [Actinoplanes couchii]GID60786.1 hypothetical protein Aco03nite_091900 [Actinoplanes couchii]
MEFIPVLVTLAVLALIVVAFMKLPWAASVGMGVALVLVSGWLLNTLYIDEYPYMDHDANSIMEGVVFIGGSLLVGVFLAVTGLRRRPRAQVQ